MNKPQISFLSIKKQQNIKKKIIVGNVIFGGKMENVCRLHNIVFSANDDMCNSIEKLNEIPFYFC